MSNIGYYNNGNILKEGNFYDFQLVKIVRLEDQKEYMILEDQYSIRHFVEYEHYKNYNLSITENIKCFIEKINCTGRVILEPEHPVYKRGGVYQFNIRTIVEKDDFKVFTVLDCFGNDIEVHAKNVNNKPEIIHPTMLNAKVLKIKKGVPEIEITD